MAGPSMAAQRTLTLTEELEKIEQSITLTLQEIDSNFSRAHRIVTSSILPVVEQYAEHSRGVWEGSKFWKQFFEASANVSLNGYEEAPDEEEDDADQTITTNDGDEEDLLSQSTPASRTGTSSFMDTPGRRTDDHAGGTDARRPSDAPRDTPGSVPGSVPGSMTPTSKTQRASTQQRAKGRTEARSPSPTPSGTLPPETPRAQTFTEEDSTISATTPELPQFEQSARKTPGSGRQQNDALLHRVLDKNYRVQATPLGKGKYNPLAAQMGARQNPQTPATVRTGALNFDLDSSPMEEAPQIRAGLFPTSPRFGNRNHASGPSKSELEAQRTRDRIPGVSVLEKHKSSGPRVSLSRAARQSIGAAGTAGLGGIGAPSTAHAAHGTGWSDSDDDDDDNGFGGMSPPKTMAFNVPTSKLMQTPAREVSRRIVEDLLATAGGENMSGLGQVDSPDSPSIIRKDINFAEETF